MGYDVLGKLIYENEFEQFWADVGVLEERRWKQLEWESPVDKKTVGSAPTRHRPTSLRSYAAAF